MLRLNFVGPISATVVLLVALSSGCENFTTCEKNRSCKGVEGDANGGADGAADVGVGKACASEGELACDDQGLTSLSCKAGQWAVASRCAGPDMCDVKSGECLECLSDSDCDDQMACNGQETCSKGSCKAGTDPCEPEKEAGCTISCSEDSGKATCSKAPTDEDGDGHLAVGNSCSAKTDLPKDDCDDTRASVNPAADEVCDGVDNDCDGKNDLADGFGIGGDVRTLISSNGAESLSSRAATWSADLGRWLVVVGTSKRVVLFKLFPNGAPDGDPLVLVDDAKNHPEPIALGTRGAEIGVVWGTPGAGASPPTVFKFARFSISGATATRTDVVPLDAGTNVTFPKVVGLEDGGWLLTATEGGKGTVRRVSSAGAALAPTVNLGVTGFSTGAAATAGRAVYAWESPEYDASDVFLGGVFRFASWSGSMMTQLDAPTIVWPTDANLYDGYTQVLPSKEGVVLLLRPRGKDTHVMRVPFVKDGLACGPVALTATSTPIGVDGEVYATGNESTGFFLARGANTGPYVAPVPYDCDVNTTFASRPAVELGIPDLSGMNHGLASSPEGHLVAIFGGGSVKTRAFGNLFCDSLASK